MTPAGGRRSKIRPPRKSLISSSYSDSSSADGSVDFEKNWAVLQNAISQIQNKNVSNLSYEQLYRKAYVLVIRKFGEKLYDNVANSVTEHLLAQRAMLLAMTDNPETFIQSLIREWDEHLQSMKFIGDVLMYLNRVYVKEHKRLLIYDLGVQLFKDNVIMYNDNEIGSRMMSIILNEILKSRDGVAVTTNMYITKLMHMMESLAETNVSSEVHYGENYYQTIFEPAFLSSSEQYFQNLAKSFVLLNSGSKYLHAASQFIKEEENRMKLYLPQSSHPKVTNLMNNILIKDKIDQVILSPTEGMEYWLNPLLSNVFRDNTSSNETHHIADLKMLYNLVGRIDEEYQILRLRLKEALVSQGSSIPEWARNSLESASSQKKTSVASTVSFATKWVESILKYKKQMMDMWNQSFDSDLTIESTLAYSLRDIINNNNNNSSSSNNNYNKRTGSSNSSINAPELLSIYMDYNIKQIGKGSISSELNTQPGDEVENLITNSIQLLRFIKDKDAFEAYYANHFAKRFLNSKNSGSGSTFKGMDIEEQVLSKLCEEMGNTSLDKVIKMSKDIKISIDTTKEWKKHLTKPDMSKSNLVELDLKICNVASWPNSLTKDYKNFVPREDGASFVWPRQLRETILEFEEFWLAGKNNDNKSLYWSPKYGSVDMRISYPSRTYDINMSVFAAIIMLLFAPSSSLDGEETPSPFSENRQYSYTEIFELTGIPEQELKRHLQSIAVAPKSRLLVKVPMSKDINENDVFKLNDKFKAPTTKVKVLTVSMSSSVSSTKTKKTNAEAELDEVNAHILEARKIELNAAIVRILKSRRSVKHNELVEGLVRQLNNRFQPSIMSIKQRIEDLIDKEYLQRDVEDRNLYHYIA